MISVIVGNYRKLEHEPTYVERASSEITYVYNSAFKTLNQCFEQGVWDAQTDLTWEPNADFVVENVFTDQVDCPMGGSGTGLVGNAKYWKSGH